MAKKKNKERKNKIEKIEKVDKELIIVTGLRPVWFGNRKVLPGEEAEIETKYLIRSPGSFKRIDELNKQKTKLRRIDNNGIMEGKTSNN